MDFDLFVSEIVPFLHIFPCPW